MKIKFTHLYLLVLFLQGIIIVIFAPDILPPKYFFDATTIRNFYVLDYDDNIDSGFANTAKFYSLFGFGSINDDPILEGLFTYSLFYFCIVWIIYKTRHVISCNTFFFMSIWNIPSAIYLGQLTKEIIPILLFTIIINVLISKTSWKLSIVILFLLLYTYFFRKYWIISIYWSACVSSFLLLKYRFKTENGMVNLILRWAILISSILVVFLAASYQDMYLTDVRDIINISRQDSDDAITATKNIIENSSIFTDIVNWFYLWVSLLFPIQFIMLQPMIFGIAIWNVLNVYVFSSICMHIKNQGICLQWILPIAWIISFSLTQGLFEPDFGSYLRHQIVLLPLYLFLFAQYKTNYSAMKKKSI